MQPNPMVIISIYLHEKRSLNKRPTYNRVGNCQKIKVDNILFHRVPAWVFNSK